ncbi:MAG: nucleotidyltransferase domain-containing protein [Candidatus Verstraetearchaeota archaeon]|nr:nucleotidyltransferase domain-containing protein [Candidatus Verstraetearchaeota archaeon]
MAKKVAPPYEAKDVVYSKEHWDLLNSLRRRALEVIEALSADGIESRVYGSLARGDVNEKSDIDIVIPETIDSFRVEEAIMRGGFRFEARELTQATPVHTLKATIYLDPTLKVTFPLIPMRGKEREFYRFGGELDHSEISMGKRVPGIDKRLMLIIPTEQGHLERSVLSYEAEAAKTVGVHLETVLERVRVLRRRDNVGRTGIFFKRHLSDDETFEGVLNERLSSDPSLRRLIQQRSKG